MKRQENRKEEILSGDTYTRRDLLKGLGAMSLYALGVSRCKTPRQSSLSKRSNKDGFDKPNILFVTTDYQRGVDGPSLGSAFLEMPALDRLLVLK